MPLNTPGRAELSAKLTEGLNPSHPEEEPCKPYNQGKADDIREERRDTPERGDILEPLAEIKQDEGYAQTASCCHRLLSTFRTKTR